MSRPITLFSGYAQRENRTTNYCLLILKMLYEESPKLLAEVLATLVGEELGERIGVKFRQQERKAGSVPDGLIVQPAFSVYIETKNADWFHDGQLERHLDALNAEAPGLKVLIALSAFEADGPDRFAAVRRLCDERYKNAISFASVSFDDLVQALKLDNLPKALADAVADFRNYLDEENLLPSWVTRLDAVNCAGFPDDVLSANVYTCPATGGAYNHARCKFFGMYRWKRVEKVAVIEAVVDVEGEAEAKLKWRNVPGTDDGFCRAALEKVRLVQQSRPRPFPLRVFLLGPLYDTNFRKDSPGGMFGSKRYFDIGHLDAVDAEQLAAGLSGKMWA